MNHAPVHRHVPAKIALVLLAAALAAIAFKANAEGVTIDLSPAYMNGPPLLVHGFWS